MPLPRSLITLASALSFAGVPLAAHAANDAVPKAMLGTWGVSQGACAEGITPSFLEVRRDALGLFYGHAEIAEIAEVERTGPVLFLCGDLHQEGQVDPGVVTAFYRLEQPDGPDKLRFKEKDLEAVDLIRCTKGTASGLPLRVGVYVTEGASCSSPANAELRVFDGVGLSGSATRGCRPVAVTYDVDTYAVTQSCIDTYSGERTIYTEVLTITNEDRFEIEEGPSFRLCAPEALPDDLREVGTVSPWK